MDRCNHGGTSLMNMLQGHARLKLCTQVFGVSVSAPFTGHVQLLLLHAHLQSQVFMGTYASPFYDQASTCVRVVLGKLLLSAEGYHKSDHWVVKCGHLAPTQQR